MILTFSILQWIIQGAAFIAAILYYNQYKKSTQKYFVYFLGYVLLTEIFGFIIGSLKYDNLFIYNIFTIVSFTFYLYWFSKILVNTKIVFVLAIAFYLSVIYALFYESFTKDLWSIPLTVGTIIALILSTLYYRNLLTKTDVINFKNSQEFWIVSGLLIFYIGFLPIQLFWYISDIRSMSLRIMITILNIILYGCFIKSFICLKK